MAETRKLDPATRAARLQKRVKAADPEEDQQELNRSGAIGALFNLLGRTSGASAEAAYALTDTDPETTFVGGLKKGITGKAEHSYKDVLSDNLGVEGPVGAIGGFIGDVALDPLTYIGAKRIKGISEPEAFIKAVQSGSDDVASETARIMAESPTRVGLTVAGKTFSTKAPKPLGITEKLLGPETDRKLIPRLFSQNAELPLGLAEMGRVIDSSNNASFVNFRNQMKQLYDGLDPEEQRLIARARDTGESLENVPVINTSGTRFNTLGDYIKASQKINDDFFVEEGKLGLFTLKKGKTGDLPTDYKEYNPNYVYHFYNKPNEKALRDGVAEIPVGKLAGSEKSGFMKKRTADVTLEEAKELGWEPVENIGELMEMRAGKHFRSMAAGAQVRDAIEQFGITREDYARLGRGVEGNSGQVKDLKWVPATSIEGPVASKYGDKMVPEFVAKAMNQAWTTYKDGATGAEAMKLHDKIMSNWKFGNTAIMPSYHIRNTFGDFMLNLADGVKNPTRYNQAARVLRDKDAINARTLNTMLGTADVATGELGEGFIKLGGQKLTTDQVFDLYGKSGAKSGFISSEIQKSMSDFEKKSLNNFVARKKAWVGDKVAEPREEFFRLAHFIDSLSKEMKIKGSTIDEAAMRAGARVRKFNIDYGKLSQFEKRFMNKIIPFYTWMRKSTPLNMEMLFTKPGFMALYPKGQNLAQGLLGTDDAEGELLIPDWIRESAPVRLAVGKEESRNFFQKIFAGVSGLGEGEPGFLQLAGETGGLAPTGSIAAPVGAVQQLAGGNVGAAVGALAEPIQGGFSPLIKAPIELGTGRELFTGRDINYNSYALQQLGGPGRILNPYNGSSLKQALFQAGTGISIAGATAGRQEGEFMRRQNVRAGQTKSTKEAALRKRFGARWDTFSEAKQEKLRQGLQLKKTDEDRTATRQRRYLTQILGQ